MASTPMKMKQFRYYYDDSPDNAPFSKLTSYCDQTSFEAYKPIYQLGIQTLPGTQFYINTGLSPIVIGSTGIYEADLTNTTATISGIRFNEQSMQTIANVPNGYLIIDIVYGGEEVKVAV